MKKIIIALALVMTMSFAASAQDGFVADWSMGGDIFRTGGFFMPLRSANPHRNGCGIRGD